MTPTEEYAKSLEQQADAILHQKPIGKVWLPVKVEENGEFKNLTQGLVVSKGPRQGKCVKGRQTGQTYWKPGQHIMKRQRNAKNPDEATLGTKQLFWNAKMDVKALEGEDLIAGSQMNSSTTGKGATRVLSWGRWKNVYARSNWDEIAAEAMLEVAAQVRGTQPTVSRESESKQGSVVDEGHN